MPTTIVNFSTDEGIKSYTDKARVNHEFFKKLYGGSPAAWADKLSIQSGPNWDRMQFISKKYGLDFGSVVGTNLSDECINDDSGSSLQQHLGCTSVAKDHIIGQTLDLFTVELCIIREPDALYVTFPPYLCVLGLGRHLAMCTNHLFDSVCFKGVPISHIRRTLLELPSLEKAINFLKVVRPTTSVNLLLSDGEKSINIEVSPTEVKIIQPRDNKLAHTNHVLTSPFHEDCYCSRLQIASRGLLDDKNIEQVLGQEGVVQPIEDGFGTIITVWIDAKKKVLAYKDPGQAEFKVLSL